MTTTQFYFGFGGQVSRARFWLHFMIPVTILTFVIHFAAKKGSIHHSALIVWSILLVWPFIAVLAKRWHDRNKTGWWRTIGFIPVVGQLWILIECGFFPTRLGLSKKQLRGEYDLKKIEADELYELLEETRAQNFCESSELSKYIIENNLCHKYENIAGIVRMKRGEDEWDFKGGFSPYIYSIICKHLRLSKRRSSARAVGFTSFKVWLKKLTGGWTKRPPRPKRSPRPKRPPRPRWQSPEVIG